MKRTARMIVEVVYDDTTHDPPGPAGCTDPDEFTWEPDVSDWHPLSQADPELRGLGAVSEDEITVVEIIDPGTNEEEGR